MKPKVLFVASIALHIKAFHLPYLKWFQEQGYETHIACSEKIDLPFVDHFWEVDFIRSPFSFGHFKAFKQLKRIITEQAFSVISTHTPMASVLSRLAANGARKNGTKLVYMAHGFHFFRGASFFSWLFYYPIELLLTNYTDAIICINKEDYESIKSKGADKCSYYLVPGIGVNGNRFSMPTISEKEQLKLNFKIDRSKIVGIYAAEFIDRKNHEFLIDALANHRDQFNNFLLLFAGRGVLEEQLKKRVKDLDLEHMIQFIGFRSDMPEVYKLSDIGISSSKQEGLPINIVEEMLTGLPIICTRERGHSELIQQGRNGFMFKVSDANDFISKLRLLVDSFELRKQMGEESAFIAKKFELSNALNSITQIYRSYMS